MSENSTHVEYLQSLFFMERHHTEAPVDKAIGKASNNTSRYLL